jgi:hypothetical protein
MPARSVSLRIARASGKVRHARAAAFLPEGLGGRGGAGVSFYFGISTLPMM